MPETTNQEGHGWRSMPLFIATVTQSFCPIYRLAVSWPCLIKWGRICHDYILYPVFKESVRLYQQEHPKLHWLHKRELVNSGIPGVCGMNPQGQNHEPWDSCRTYEILGVSPISDSWLCSVTMFAFRVLPGTLLMMLLRPYLLEVLHHWPFLSLTLSVLIKVLDPG